MYRVLTSLTTEHDWRLVVVAGLICFLSSLVAINLFHHARAATQTARASWIVRFTLANVDSRNRRARNACCALCEWPNLSASYERPFEDRRH